ncbi:FixH family protein [Helicobacter brantae]|uniref:YtkA-like domain-containing protein n=1 Tax=Helicobacter brantae TaxID=375927 RepID=A0A3D8J1J6_9HELI|nr:FixH family protein [Helicobacter brantae]RDU71387.1 hypothetical protein CQA58_02245 [Helicobacter brantae]
MKKILFVLIALFGFAFAQGGKVGGMEIEYSTKKPLSSGGNEFLISLKKDGVLIKGAKITLKAIMPPMPSMPKMDFEAKAKEVAEGYEAVVHFPHGGTWQLKFLIELNGKKYTYKSSVDF